ncbi:hypothetical protein ACFP9V_25025 [Deinococcus radiopugnans]|uniref:DUF4177 domain-containing protein n=1 Tax=Deinococcus radiopugnans ATCC 19172 TaxID=585398 RepID=A0A5C4XNF6_9DEIO|nr:hypothetical protein [Deinococcus radiopugnans]MBB6018744.1 hypothetical protein [Deinococcus radiopugnans ATCC 19172]TNM64381.1 hypothetical protein FHR04_19785 [Deinococcus radiopugnans ATCC 19172]
MKRLLLPLLLLSLPSMAQATQWEYATYIQLAARNSDDLKNGNIYSWSSPGTDVGSDDFPTFMEKLTKGKSTSFFFPEFLNFVGRDGWELVSVYEDQQDKIEALTDPRKIQRQWFIFKRPAAK